jgi:DNA-binding NarL/FixJ family response regulator
MITPRKAPSLLPGVITHLVNQTKYVHDHDSGLDGVTDREREVLTLVGQGLSNTEIAEKLHLTIGTVKTHIGRLLAKLQARDRAQLVIAAYDTGLVGGPPG